MVTESPLRGQWVRAGTGIAHVELERLWRRLSPWPRPPCRSTRPSAYQPVRLPARLEPRALGAAELVAEVKFLTWADDNLLRQVVYQGLREDKPALEVRRGAAREAH